MNYKTFLERIINEGIEAVKADYTKETQQQQLEGSIAGFEACRNLEPTELLEMFQIATKYMNEASIERRDTYWYFRCYQSEVEWVINVVSAMLINEGEQPLVSYLPTVRGLMKANEILKSGI